MAALAVSSLCLLFLVPALTQARLFLSPSSRVQLLDDVVLVDYHNWAGVSRSFSNGSFVGTTASGANYTAYVAALYDELPYNFSFQLPSGGCKNLSVTSSTAKLHGCTYSTNAGYFRELLGGCIGNLVINSTTVQITGGSRVNFGLLDSTYIVGYLSNTTLLGTKYKFHQLITGAGWLVRDGEVWIGTSAKLENISEGFVNEKAPRTAICAAKNGTLILLQVDGEEDIKKGVDLMEFSQILLSVGCWQAVNLDGGGSSTSVYDGHYVNRPTCFDTSNICERPVSTITCIKSH